MTVIETIDITKIYATRLKKGNIIALDGVSLSIPQGEIFGLLGPNGAGKTTLVKCLLGITRITSGEAFVGGLSPGDPMSRAKVGFLPENHRFPPYLTGWGLLELTGKLFGMSEVDIEEAIHKLLPLVGMERWASTKVGKYSKGMSQRIGLAQALMADPDIIFLDEPTDGVDPVGKMELRRVFERIRDEGKTIFLNSHLLSEVESIADRVGILSNGKIIRMDTVKALTSRHKQYEIEAEIGNERIEIPPEIGEATTITSVGMIVKLKNDDDINYVIDQIRLKRIKIRSVVPLKVSLEQSFIEELTASPERTA